MKYTSLLLRSRKARITPFQLNGAARVVKSFFIAVFSVVNGPLATAAPVVNELLASNQGNEILDEDGAPSDWIEIYNPDSETVDLSGYFLSDDPEQPDKWRFPETSFLAGGRYSIVFASGKNRAVAGSELHTNFSLSAAGESVVLTGPDGKTRISEVSFPEQLEGVSYGIGVTGSTVFSSPVEPGAACQWLVPDRDIGVEWLGRDFDDSSWTSARTAVGFGYEQLTGEGGDAGDAMQSVNASIYVRVPFIVEKPGELLNVTLRMRYEDGFVAYLNGTRVAGANTPSPLQWNAQSTESRRDNDAKNSVDFDLAFQNSLVPGENILAIHGLNASRGGSDLLVLPELIVESRIGEARHGYFLTPTPGETNAPRIDGFVDPLEFDRIRGHFEEPFQLSIRSATNGTTIRYTLDGSVPSIDNGMTYSAPIEISTTTILRAVALRGGWEPSPVETQTYVFLEDVLTQDSARAVTNGLPSSWRGTRGDYDMDPDIVEDPEFGPQLIPALKKVPTVSLVTSVDDMFGASGVYSNPGSTGVRSERPVSMEFFDSTTGESFQINCGFRAQGGAFRSFGLTKKKSLRLLFKGIYGNTKLRYPVFGRGTGAVDEFDTLTLRMEANDGWQWDGAQGQPQYARDEFGRRTQLALGHASGHGRSVHLYINGFYWGVYNLVERPDAGFAEAYYGVPKETWDGMNTGGGINGGSIRPFNNLNRLTAAIRTGDSEAERTAAYYRVMGLRPDGSNDPELESYLDVDNFIDYLLVNWYMANTDWPHNNFYCGREQGPDTAGYRFFMWDAEWTLFIGGSVNTDQTRNYSGVAQPQRGLRNSLEYRMRFADRAHRALFHGGALTPEACAARYDAFVKDHPLILIAESARWGDQHRTSSPRTVNDWQREYNRIKSSWFPRRTDTFIGQLRRTNLYPEIDAPEFNQRGGHVTEGFRLAMTAPPGTTVYYTLDGSDPRLPVLGDASALENELISENAARSFHVPAGANDGFSAGGVAWSSPDFPESDRWRQTTGPIGFESSGGGFGELVEYDLRPEMQGRSAAVLVRIPFFLTRAQLDELDFLNLRVKYDDGFVAFINGVHVASANAPEAADGDSTATDSHPDSEALLFEEFAASSGLKSLRPGSNVLAIIGLNRSRGGSDFFNSVQLGGGSDQTISPSAAVYSEPIALSSSAIVKTRARAGEEWSALEQAPFFVGTLPAAANNLVISEFSYRPPAPSESERESGFVSRSDFEYLELTNTSASVVSLAGVTIDEGVTHTFAESGVVTPGESVVAVSNRDAFLLRYGVAMETRVVGVFNGKLSNSGERISLNGADGVAISSFTFSDSPPWPAGDMDTGFSLELVAPRSRPDPSIPHPLACECPSLGITWAHCRNGSRVR